MWFADIAERETRMGQNFAINVAALSWTRRNRQKQRNHRKQREHCPTREAWNLSQCIQTLYVRFAVAKIASL